MTALVALDLAGRTGAHLARALDAHRLWCRANGHSMPADLVQLVALLSMMASNGQSRTTSSAVDDLADTAPVVIAYTFAEAGTLLGVSERTVRRLVAAGELRSISVASAPRIHREDLEYYAQRLRSEKDGTALVANTGRTTP